MNQETQKQNVSQYVVDHLDNCNLIAVGSGSTVNYFLEKLLKKCPQIKIIGASSNTSLVLQKLGIEEVKLGNKKRIPLYIDGADLILENKPGIIIKGHGGALTNEKIMWRASDHVFVICDSFKLGTRISKKIPIEIIKKSFSLLEDYFIENQNIIDFNIRMSNNVPFISDNGNFIVDLQVDHETDLEHLHYWLKRKTGIIETGIFCPPLTDNMTIFISIGNEIKIISP